MDAEKLLEKTGRYLDDYLEGYPDLVSDVRHFAFGMPIHPGQLRQYSPDDITSLDMHKTIFEGIYSDIPEARLKDFSDEVAKMEAPVVLDIGSEFGERFGYYVALQNADADVIVMNKRFVDADPVRVAMRRLPLSFDSVEIPKQGEGFIGDFYKDVYQANGIANIKFEETNVTRKVLDSLAQKYAGRNVVIFSERTPTMPVGMTEVISGAVRENENMDMVLMPVVNTVMTDYVSDPRMAMISEKHRVAFDKCPGKTYRGPETAATRIYAAMNQYLALKGAVDAGGDIYRRGRAEEGFFFNRPPFYASTIKPTKQD